MTAYAVVAGSNCDPVTAITTVPHGPDMGESVTIGSTVKDGGSAIAHNPASAVLKLTPVTVIVYPTTPLDLRHIDGTCLPYHHNHEQETTRPRN